MSSLFQQINEEAVDQDNLTSLVLENTRALFEGFTNASMQYIAESAAKYLGQIALQIQNKKIQNLDNAIDMVAGLRVLGSATNRDAFNIKQPTFKVLVNKAGEAPNVDAALVKLARNPSVKSVREEISRLLNAALQGSNNDRTAALQTINKLRLGYERVQGMLSNMGQEPSGNSKPAATPAPNQAGAQQAAKLQPQSQPNAQPAAQPQQQQPARRSGATA